MTDHIVNRWSLRIGAIAHLLWTVIFHGGRDHHAIHIHMGEGLLVFVSGFCIARATFAGTTVSHQRTYFFPRADNDDARIGDLRILIGCDMILVVVVAV